MLINTTRPADGIVALTLNRDEKRNALNEELLVALEGELERALIDASSVLLTGAGSAFSARIGCAWSGGGGYAKRRLQAWLESG